MLLDNNKVELPDSLEQFRGTLEGYYVELLSYANLNNRAVESY